MTLVDAPDRATAPAYDRPPGRARRIWGAPLWAHLAALSVILVLVMPLAGTSASFSADEGAAIIQAQSLSDGEGWIVPHPVPEIDPEGRNYPLELSAEGDKGVAPFGKHPLYALLLAGADRLGGHVAMVLLSILGTVAAAGLAGAHARRIGPGLDRPAIWVVGLASPLLFDGYLVMGHTLAAALVAAAALAALTAVERRRPLAALAVLVFVTLAVLLRTEAFVLGIALAVAAASTALRRPRWPGLLVAATALAAAGGGRLLEGLWGRSLVGAASGTNASGAVGGESFLADKINAFALTWLRPGYGENGAVVEIALVIMAMAIVLAVWALRRDPGGRNGAVVLAAIAALSAVVALAAAPKNLVPGFLVAFPIGLAGLASLRTATLRTLAARVLTITFVLFAAGVIATQYDRGGSGEWGGRYFALGIPLLVPVVLLALRESAEGVARRSRQALAAGLAVCSLSMAVMSVVSIRSTHVFTDRLMTSIDQVSRNTGEERPLLVTTSPLMPRLAWKTFDDQRWLLSTPADLPSVVDRLRSAGVGRFTLVTRDLERDGGALWAEDNRKVGRWHILIVNGQ
ncbi:MAG: hypothetical protein ABR540_08265 [Acidimicrobiales bacterium]